MQFNQPDSIIPDPYNALDWNRYAYARYNPLIYTDPTGHDPVLSFIGGFLKELARTNLWWHPGAQRDLAIHNNESTAELTGRLVADVASMAIGVAEAGGGAGIAGGGVVACGTGVGCLVTPEALVAGGALIAQGAGTTLSAANGAGTVLAMLSNNSNSSSNADLSRIYDDTYPKHHPNSPPNVGPMDLDKATAQEVLNQGIQNGKQIYSYYNGRVYVFQPGDGMYHGYIYKSKVPTAVLKQWLDEGMITRPQYNKMINWPARGK